MRKFKKFWAPTLSVLFLMVTLVGAAPASDKQAPLGEAARVVLVGMADCMPAWDIYKYVNSQYSSDLRLREGGAGVFNCPVHFPEYGGHWVYRIEVGLYDNNPNEKINVGAYQMPGWRMMGGTSSLGASSSWQTRVISGSWLTNRWVLPKDGMIIRINFTRPEDLKAQWIRVWYILG